MTCMAGRNNKSDKGGTDNAKKGTKPGPPDQAAEKVQDIPLSELHPFKNHPFKVLDDEAMQQTVDSILQYGVMVPAIARPSPEGGYELIAGHRRLRASALAGKETMPVIVREMDDDAATIFMVDSNLQREELLPSERAFAYRMKNEAMKRQAGRPGKENVGQLVPNSFGRRTTELIGELSGESYKQVQRFIRLTYLIPELLDMVDQRKAPGLSMRMLLLRILKNRMLRTKTMALLRRILKQSQTVLISAV